MTEITFFVETGEQSPLVNKLLRAADFADGAVIRDRSGFEVSVQWKDGKIIDKKRIAKTKQNLQNSFEAQGYCVLAVRRLFRKGKVK